jgi:hypothetical protein
VGPLTFFFDRTFGTRLPKALSSMKPPVAIKWHQEEGFSIDSPDDEWLGKVGPKKWVVLSQDRKWHRVESELAAIKQHNIRCFYLPCASEPRWFSLCLIAKIHEKMMELANEEPAPFIFDITKKGKFQMVDLP